MIKMINDQSVALSIIILLFGVSPSSAETKTATPDWYLVDEIIEDKAPDYRSDVFFADKASIKPEHGYTSVSISQIIMSQVDNEGASESAIKDIRSRILIDCNQHMYAATEIAEYDRNDKVINSKTQTMENAKWILPFADSGYVSVFRFACEPDVKFGSQKFPSHIQPLLSVMAYVNADWSN